MSRELLDGDCVWWGGCGGWMNSVWMVSECARVCVCVCVCVCVQCSVWIGGGCEG